LQHPPKKPIRKKSRKRLVGLVMAALILSASLVLILPAIRQRFPAQTLEYEINQPTVRTIGTREAVQIDSITLWPSGEDSYTLYMQDGRLMLDRNGTLAAIDETYQKEILDTLTQISVQNTVTENAAEASDELEAMGLISPQAKAMVRYLDGSEETMEVGAVLHGSAEHYFRWSGAPGIYVCHSGVPEVLTLSEKALLPFEQVSISPSLVDRLRIQNANGECVFAFNGGSSGKLVVPRSYPISDDTAQTMIAALANFRLGSYEAPLTDENRADYGFDDPLCTLEITQREGVINVITEEGSLSTAQMEAQRFHFVIGRAEGEFFYTCAYQEQVYLISRFLVETLVQADWQTLLSRTPAAMGDALLTDIVFETAESTIEVQIVRTESVLENNQLELDVEGNPVYHTSVTVNGREAPQELADMLADSLRAFTVEGSIPANAKPEEEPRWRITLVTENGDIRVLEGYRLDVFSDAVAVDGTMCHYVYDEAIDVLMAGLV